MSRFAKFVVHFVDDEANADKVDINVLYGFFENYMSAEQQSIGDLTPSIVKNITNTLKHMTKVYTYHDILDLKSRFVPYVSLDEPLSGQLADFYTDIVACPKKAKTTIVLYNFLIKLSPSVTYVLFKEDAYIMSLLFKYLKKHIPSCNIIDFPQCDETIKDLINTVENGRTNLKYTVLASDRQFDRTSFQNLTGYIKNIRNKHDHECYRTPDAVIVKITKSNADATVVYDLLMIAKTNVIFDLIQIRASEQDNMLFTMKWSQRLALAKQIFSSYTTIDVQPITPSEMINILHTNPAEKIFIKNIGFGKYCAALHKHRAEKRKNTNQEEPKEKKQKTDDNTE